MALYYVETGRGCSIREGRTARSVEARVLKEVGTIDGVRLVRKATQQDIDHVRGMGGHIPAAHQATKEQGK